MTAKEALEQLEDLEMEIDELDDLAPESDELAYRKVRVLSERQRLIVAMAQKMAKRPKLSEESEALLSMVVLLAEGMTDALKQLLEIQNGDRRG